MSLLPIYFISFTVKTCAAESFNHSVVSPSKTSYQYEEYVNYTCEVGYKNSAGSPVTRKCIGNNTWTGPELSCTSKQFYLMFIQKCILQTFFNKQLDNKGTKGPCLVRSPVTRQCNIINTWTGTEPSYSSLQVYVKFKGIQSSDSFLIKCMTVIGFLYNTVTNTRTSCGNKQIYIKFIEKKVTSHLIDTVLVC